MVFFLTVLFVFSANAVSLTEQSLIELSKKDTPHNYDQLAKVLSANFQKREYENNYGLKITAEGKHERTKQKPLISFSPVFSPVTQAGVGVSKNLFYGMNINASVGYDKRDFLFLGSNTFRETVVGQVGLNIDLWRDLFGRKSRSRQEQMKTSLKMKELEKKTADQQYKINIRKMYWNLVANKEKLILAKKLYQQSIVQATQIKQRYKNSIADKGDVANINSLVANRKGQIISLEYQRSQMHTRLQTMIPNLLGKNIVIGDYDIPNAMKKVLSCTQKIKMYKQAPYENTYMDEVIDYIKQLYNLESKVTSIYGDPDLKLALAAKTTGVGDESINATDDFQDNDRSGYSVGLQLTIPVGYEDAKTKDIKKSYERNKHLAAITNTETQLKATHMNIVTSIDHLFAVIAAQKENNANLQTKMNVTKKKYKQGRISLSELIQDQDKYLGGELNVIDTKLMILETVFNYLSVYSTTPCELNRI